MNLDRNCRLPLPGNALCVTTLWCLGMRVQIIWICFLHFIQPILVLFLFSVDVKLLVSTVSKIRTPQESRKFFQIFQNQTILFEKIKNTPTATEKLLCVFCILCFEFCVWVCGFENPLISKIWYFCVRASFNFPDDWMTGSIGSMTFSVLRYIVGDGCYDVHPYHMIRCYDVMIRVQSVDQPVTSRFL